MEKQGAFPIVQGRQLAGLALGEDKLQEAFVKQVITTEALLQLAQLSLQHSMLQTHSISAQ